MKKFDLDGGVDNVDETIGGGYVQLDYVCGASAGGNLYRVTGLGEGDLLSTHGLQHGLASLQILHLKQEKFLNK